MASSSNNREENFELLDSLYSAAVDGGDVKRFEQHSNRLDQILTPNGNTILHIHITARPRRACNQLEKTGFLREMLQMCPDLLWKSNKKGETLLHMAARHGHADVAKYLLEECKKPYRNHDQELGIKATRQMLQMTSYEAKETALHEAVRYNHLDVVEILTKEDPKLPHHANTDGETPLYLAAERGYTRVLKEILGTCDSPADHGPCGRRSLHAAVIGNNEVATVLLLDKERILESKRDEQGWTPLHFAAHLGYIEIAKKLLIVDKSAAYKANDEGKTALHVAASLGKVDIMQELISSCPGCCELVDKRGRNALHFAAKSNNKEAVRLILRNPALGNLINEKDGSGNTPFLEAISMHSMIISHPKVDRLVFNNRNRNAVDIASEHFLLWSPLEFILWYWLRKEVNRCRRILSKDDDEEGEENKGDPVSSKSNDIRNGKSRRLVESIKEATQSGLVAATLIATVTFAAGFAVPGGFITDKAPNQGAPILTRNKAFRAFVILNTMSFILSSLAVFSHLSGRSADHAITVQLFKRTRFSQSISVYAMVAMIGAFLAGTCAVLHCDEDLAIAACVVPVAMFAFIRIANNIETLWIMIADKLYNWVRKPDEGILLNSPDLIVPILRTSSAIVIER